MIALYQSSTPLVKFKTLSLMQLVLRRATAVIEHFGAQSTFTGEYMYMLRLSDHSVLCAVLNSRCLAWDSFLKSSRIFRM